MTAGECYLGLGLLLGILIGALFAHGNARRASAQRKIDALKAEQAKAKGIVDKAIERRRQGTGEMPGALFLMLLAIMMLILTLYMLASGDGLF
jgi:hypothetical protein